MGGKIPFGAGAHPKFTVVKILRLPSESGDKKTAPF
jgi:hypothetical protein